MPQINTGINTKNKIAFTLSFTDRNFLPGFETDL